MPPGGDGFYYFSTYFLMDEDEYGQFSIEINGSTICTVRGDNQGSTADDGQSACSAATYATEGLSMDNICPWIFHKGDGSILYTYYYPLISH